jgi:AcrR family transcriptional regulator
MSTAEVELEQLGRRERKKLETRRALASAALRLAAERGPDQVTIEEIADSADVSVRTFFNYFSSKEEAIVGWDPEGNAELAAALRDRPASEAPLTALRHVFLEALEGFEDHADERALRIRLVREHASLLPRHLAAHYERERGLTEALAERLGLDAQHDLYPALVVTTSSAALRLALFRWEALERSVPLPDLLTEAFAGLEAGLAPPSGGGS